MIDNDLLARYRAFRGRTGIIGRDAEVALSLARAEQRAERHGLHCIFEPEEESYRSVYGEDPPAGVSFYCAVVYALGDEHDVLASLGFVDDADPMYMREVAAQLYEEALDILDKRAEAAASAEARELQARATYAQNVSER